MRHHGIVIEDRGSAIVTVDHAGDGTLLCSAMERLPFDLGTVTTRARAITEPDHRLRHRRRGPR